MIMKSKLLHKIENREIIVGVIGLGRIGRNFAIKAHALEYNIIGYDPYYKENENTKFIKIKSR